MAFLDGSFAPAKKGSDKVGLTIPPKRRPAIWRAKWGRSVVARLDDYRQRYKVEMVPTLSDIEAEARSLN